MENKPAVPKARVAPCTSSLPDKNFWGGHGIVAGQTPLGLGLAYGLKYLGRKAAASATSVMAR
jgi:TPP-dependent pyruvate/acetoin dehydrogenase alpha subunit